MNHDAAETVAENRRRIHAFVERLRSHLPYPVIDSALLEVSHWDGHDYGEFFIEVLRRHAKEIRFLDGWEYSRGATKEFVAAVEWADIALYDERGAHLSAAAGADLLRSAIADLTRYGVDAAALRQREIQLAELARSSAQVN
jgi:anti-sigma factor RsiW